MGLLSMTSEEGIVITASVDEQSTEQNRGREELRSQSKRSKSKAPTREPMESRVAGLEKDLATATSTIGELSDQVDNLIHGNSEITMAARAMIDELGKSFTGELRSLKDEVKELRKEVDALRQGSPPSLNTAATSSSTAPHCLKVLKLAMYNGTCNATMVKNFLFGLEQYFEAMNVTVDCSKISNAAIFLRDA